MQDCWHNSSYTAAARPAGAATHSQSSGARAGLGRSPRPGARASAHRFSRSPRRGRQRARSSRAGSSRGCVVRASLRSSGVLGPCGRALESGCIAARRSSCPPIRCSSTRCGRRSQPARQAFPAPKRPGRAVLRYESDSHYGAGAGPVAFVRPRESSEVVRRDLAVQRFPCKDVGVDAPAEPVPTQANQPGGRAARRPQAP